MKILANIIAAALICCFSTLTAAEPSERAYERANENASFKRGDSDKSFEGRLKDEFDSDDSDGHKKSKNKKNRSDSDESLSDRLEEELGSDDSDGRKKGKDKKKKK